MASLDDIQELKDRIAFLENELGGRNFAMKKDLYSKVKKLANSDRKRILVTGGAGFLGSHLVDRLMLAGHEVTVVDNFFTGRKKNVQHWIDHENFELINHDIVNPLFIEVDEIYHLACPASPPHYQSNPVKTIKTNTVGTVNMLGLAKRVSAKILIASTSEVYGDPEQHPQKETYWGNVNPIGPRACYDEGKRVAEALAFAYHTQAGATVDIRVARIFNTYGPRMNQSDGRVVSNFIMQALKGEPITIYGQGKQTRTFQYVSDLIEGLTRLMNGDFVGPVNIGGVAERTIEDFAKIIVDKVGGDSKIVYKDAVTDDPKQRKPDISLAREKLGGWEPKVTLEEGLEMTIAYFKKEVKNQNSS